MQLLVASPRINHTEHDLWRHSVICTFETQTGHMGFIMNQAVANIDHDNISSLYGVGRLPVNRVYCGGPVLTQRCTIMHTPEYSVSGTKRVGESAAITFNDRIVEDIVQGRGPRAYKIMLGFCQWRKGQLAQETAQTGGWLTMPATSVMWGNYKRKDKMWRRSCESGALLATDAFLNHAWA